MTIKHLGEDAAPLIGRVTNAAGASLGREKLRRIDLAFILGIGRLYGMGRIQWPRTKAWLRRNEARLSL